MRLVKEAYTDVSLLGKCEPGMTACIAWGGLRLRTLLRAVSYKPVSEYLLTWSTCRTHAAPCLVVGLVGYLAIPHECRVPCIPSLAVRISLATILSPASRLKACSAPMAHAQQEAFAILMLPRMECPVPFFGCSVCDCRCHLVGVAQDAQLPACHARTRAEPGPPRPPARLW